ncbi:MAG: sigma-70 family RNA polymerase sigma factor [Oscillospiraceae bacterium]|nr:sigma-70 family RNA polymerase sigma factor [Oscillospiraceae bacterium]
MPDRKSIYTLNKKDPEAIVYTDADRHIIRLTRADFDTEADFLKWKAWSDENYHDEEKGDHVEDNHTAPLDEKTGAADRPEVIIEQRFEKQAQERYTAETVIRIKGQLTEKQFRRLWMYCVGGLTQQQIAKAENVGQQRISTSIMSAADKIRKILSAGGKK